MKNSLKRQHFLSPSQKSVAKSRFLPAPSSEGAKGGYAAGSNELPEKWQFAFFDVRKPRRLCGVAFCYVIIDKNVLFALKNE